MNSAMSRRWRTGTAILSLAILAVAAAAPARADMFKDARCTGDPDIPWVEQIGACTSAIESGKFTGKDLAALMTNRGTAYAYSRDFNRAIADYSNAIALDPSNALALSSRGQLSEAKGDLDGAMADYTRAVELNPNDASALSNRGRVHASQNDYGAAIADYSKAIAINPKYVVALSGRGNAYDY
jgi:tetratricopeptide (TPR) repeat protein